MKKLIALCLGIVFLLASCADSKTLVVNGKETVVEPYGWANQAANKVDGVVYQISVGNIVWSVLLCETIVAPIVLTGYQLFEPVKTLALPEATPATENDKTVVEPK
jgi:hypothetical protein